MKPLHAHRRWPVFASFAAALALASIPGEARRSTDRAACPATASCSGPSCCAATPLPHPDRPATHAAGGTHARARGGLIRAASNTPAPAVAQGASGRIIALDPETGQLGAPSPEQVQALRAAAGIASVSRTDEGLTETRLSDGTVILDLGGRFQDNVVARLDRNGRLIYECVHDDGTPRKAVGDTVSTSALEER